MKKIIIIAISVTMLLCTGCAEQFTTLEDYINSTPEVTEQFKGMGEESGDYVIDVLVERNTLTYGIQYKEQLSETEIESLVPELEVSYAQSNEFFSNMVTELESATEIDTIQIVVSVCNADGTEIWNTVFGD